MAKKKSYAEWMKENYGVTNDYVERVNALKAAQDNDEDDIAPVKDERTWFQKGAFEDGYQAGDVAKTLLGSTNDLWNSFYGGIFEMGENVVDAGAYLVGGIGGLFGADKFKENTKEFIAKDLYDGKKIAEENINNLPNIISKVLGIDNDENSLFGDKVDSLAQSAGQLGGTLALQAVGVPWFVTTGVTSFGGATDQAFNEGASYGEAGLSAAITAGADILTEKLFGGSGLGEKGLINLQPLTKGITNKVFKVLADYGIDIFGEGFEEVGASVLSRLGSALYKEENLGEILLSEEALDEYLESFIGGAVLGGGMNAGKAVSSIKSGRDYRTSLTENEQKVFDKVYNDAIAEAEKDGKKLTKNEKAEIYDNMLQQMEEGEISIDTIESVLGGETYKTYQDTIANEKSLQKELEEVGNKENPTLADATKYAELNKQLEELKNNSKKDSLKAQLSDEVFNLAKNSKLAESYNQHVMRGKAFEADLSQYDTKHAEIVKKAVDSGILNNTRRTHKFVDMIAKISADKGVLFDFTNNENLKNSGFAVDGKTVNGYLTKDGVTLNIDSAKSLNSVVGHEITHVLEGTELYGALQQAITEYAKAKGDYQGRFDTLTKLYEGIKDADVNKELTADLVGDYLFTDSEFIRNLSATNRNLFQKIYDEIKYLYKVATAGSKEARELEKVKKAFEDAYRAEGKVDTNTKYSLSYTTDNRAVAVIENDIFKGKFNELSESERIKITKNALKEFRPGVPVSGRLIGITRKSAGHFTNSDYTDKIRNNDQRLYEDKLNIVQNIDDVIYASTNYINEPLNHPRNDNIRQFARGTVLLDIGGNKYEADVLVGYTSMQDMVLYDVQNLIPTDFTLKEKKAQSKLAGNESYTRKTIVPSDDIISQNSEKSSENTQYSLSTEGMTESDIENAQKVIETLKINATSSKYLDGYATYTAERMDREIRTSSASDNLDYAKSYITWVNPTDFIYATTTNETVRTKLKEEAGALDIEKLQKETQPIHLTVNFETGEIVGHEGRHRMLALSEKGVDKVAVIIDALNDNRYHTKPISMMHLEGQTFAEYRKGTDMFLHNMLPLSQRYADTARELFTNKPKSNVQFSLSSMANTFYGDANMSANDFAKLDYTQTEGYKNYVDQCVNNMRQTRADFDENTARAEIESSIEGILRVAVAAKKAGYDIYDDATKRDIKDSKNRLLFSSLEPNSDYFTSNDISTICDKRKNFADIYDDIVRSEEAKGVPQGKRFFHNVDNYFYLHNIMAEKGLTQPCRQCYVESMRKNLAPMANAFLRLVGETDANNTANDQLYGQKGKDKGKLKSNNAELREKVLETFAEHPEYGMTASDLTIETLTTEDGLAQLKIQAPLIYEAFNSFYGQSKPKMPKSATPFRFGELTALLTDHNGKIKQSLVDKINSTGGFRLQSYSDFQIQNYTDVLQVIFEAGTLGLNGHAYTKVPAFLEATEGTNLKRNISIFMYKDGNEWKLDKNDSFPAESLEEIYKLVEADKSGNTSIIAVSQNAEMSAWIMANDLVGYGIPFHKSGMKMGTVRDTNVKTDDGRIVKGYSETKDHTKQQTEVWANTTADHKALTKVKKGIDIYSFWDFDNVDNLSKNELIEKNVKAYIDACEKAGYIPKFRDYVLNNGKVLNDVLKYSKELGYASPDAIIEDISFQYKGYTIPYGYYKFLGDFGMFTPDGKASPHDTLSLENYDFDKAEQFFADSETLHRNEILQQFANDGEREQYRNSNLTAEELTEVVKQKRQEVVDSVVAPSKHSLSEKGEAPIKRGNYNVYGEDIALETAQEDIAPVQEQTTETVENTPTDSIAPTEALDETTDTEDSTTDKAEERITRSELHKNIVDGIKTRFAKKGFDFDEVLKDARNLSTFATVDNTPQRVMEKALGYEAGQILADETVNKVAHNETKGIKWLNSFTDRKNGVLAQISKRYNIKPGSKESAAAQMYAEGFYVAENNDIIQYGDAELAKDFPDAKVRENIKGLARDQEIRQIYDETLAMINESRTRNAYPEIPRLDNYFLHFRAMEDTFSKLGLPFNPNDIRAKDLPTDLNGVTADLKPGQPYFASAMHRTGKRTSFDLLGGLEKYLSSAKNQIYHIDDIQTLRALRNYIADTYGQANGLENLNELSDAEAEERIQQVYGSHLSTFAKFLNEEANIIAGKTALIDRGIEGIIGRRGITFIDTINKQVGSNMVGFNVSSSLTNFLAGVQAIAKSNKLACVKALAQTASSKIQSIFGKTDSFVENNPTIIRRKGAERFYRTPIQKIGDAGYTLMSAVDDITTEFIVRAKYNEFTQKGMSEQQAITEADKWTSRLMADRSLGQMPQLYNSKMLGLITKFQLEVRNQLDSQFYDTIQETKASNENIENNLERNAKTAAKVTKTLFELAVLQHLFGKGFEAIAGYNPAFDIIGVLATALGFDDDEESEDTALDNIEQGFFELLEDLPYTSALTGGRIPISSALPITELVKGVDQYGNEKSRWETLGEAAPYYVLPTGYGQIKKTAKGLSMFNTDEDHPIAGSYTDSGSLRFPVEDTFGNRVQAGIFGQYAGENSREYFDNGYAPLKEKQIQEYIDVDIPIKDYWEYREGLAKLETNEEKVDYIDSLDLPLAKKNILVNNVLDRKEDVSLENYDDFSSLEEFDYATKNPEKYAVAKAVGGYDAYKTFSNKLYDIKADKDANGKTISGSRKEKVFAYINGLDIDYGEKIILWKSEYKSDNTYNHEIVEYLNNREDISYDEMVTILKELGFEVDGNGNIWWD